MFISHCLIDRSIAYRVTLTINWWCSPHSSHDVVQGPPTTGFPSVNPLPPLFHGPPLHGHRLDLPPVHTNTRGPSSLQCRFPLPHGGRNWHTNGRGPPRYSLSRFHLPRPHCGSDSSQHRTAGAVHTPLQRGERELDRRVLRRLRAVRYEDSDMCGQLRRRMLFH